MYYYLNFIWDPFCQLGNKNDSDYSKRKKNRHKLQKKCGVDGHFCISQMIFAFVSFFFCCCSVFLSFCFRLLLLRSVQCDAMVDAIAVCPLLVCSGARPERQIHTSAPMTCGRYFQCMPWPTFIQQHEIGSKTCNNSEKNYKTEGKYARLAFSSLFIYNII